jgi:ParB family chromosome partitioning protein
MQSLPLSEIAANPFQPRQDYDPQELAGLVQSVQQHGVIQPIVVRPHEGRYQIVAGERRFRAAQQAGLSHMPVRVLELDDQQTFELALIENLQRRDLNAIEKALAFQEYIGRFAVTHEELAAHLGVDRSTVTNLIRLLELPGPVQQMVRSGQLGFGHARTLLSLQDPTDQVALARRIQSEELSVRQVEGLVREPQPTSAAPSPKPPGRAAAPKTNHIVSLENELRQRFGAKVEIRPKANDKGTILIHFTSYDEFERLLNHLNAA